jgi:hypothetical protein
MELSALTGVAASITAKPAFPAIAAGGLAIAQETRTVRVPAHRYTPLKESWESIVKPIVEHMKLMIRMNTKTRAVELKTSPHTADIGALQKGEDFVRAFMLGFDLADAIALLRLDDLYIGGWIHCLKMLIAPRISRLPLGVLSFFRDFRSYGREASQGRSSVSCDWSHSWHWRKDEARH